MSRAILRFRIWLLRCEHAALMASRDSEWANDYGTHLQMKAVGDRINALLDRLEAC